MNKYTLDEDHNKMTLSKEGEYIKVEDLVNYLKDETKKSELIAKSLAKSIDESDLLEHENVLFESVKFYSGVLTCLSSIKMKVENEGF